jgi:hypothetical protein
MSRRSSILTNFVAKLGAVVDEELQSGVGLIAAALGDLGLDLAGIGAADSLGVARVVGVAMGDQWSSNIPRDLPFFRTYPITFRTQAGVCTSLVAAMATLARAITATARMDLLNNMLIEGEIGWKDWTDRAASQESGFFKESGIESEKMKDKE